MTSAQRNARSDPPPHRGRRARHRSLELLAPAFDPLPRFLPGVSSSTPPLSSPGPPRIPPRRPQIRCKVASFGLQKRIQNFTRFLKAFWLPKWCQKPPKMMPKFIKNACFFQVLFFLQFWKVFWSLFQAPDPRFAW